VDAKACERPGLCLTIVSDNGCGVVKVVALWFDSENMGKGAVNAEMLRLASGISTRKLIPLMYQASSRLGSGSPDFSKALQTLVTRVCTRGDW
jgi:hypothetical protein